MAYCENCGHELNQNKYCESCGHLNENYQSNENKVVEVIHHHETEKVQEEVPEENTINESSVIEETETEKSTETDSRVEEQDNQPLIQKKQMSGFAKLSVILGLILFSVVGFGSWWWLTQKPTSEVVSKVTKTSSAVAISKNTGTEVSNTNKKKKTDQKKVDYIKTVNDIYASTLSPISGKTSAYVRDLNHPDFIYTNSAKEPFRSASIIKLFIMMTFYDEGVNKGIHLEDIYELKEADKIGGTGVLQDETVGTELTYAELVEHMIIDSDNTAGNILINALGGPKELTEYIHDKGYSNTKIERHFVDTHALNNGLDNYTSAEDVGNLLSALYQNQLVTSYEDEQMLDILKRNRNHTKLPKEIDHLVTVYNKTGEFSDYGVQSDAAIFSVNDQAYIVVVLTEDGKEQQQIKALNQFGLELNEKLFGGEQS